MPPLFGAAARAALIVLTCPSCGETQVRARGAEAYACKKCKKPIPAPAPAAKAAKKRAR